MHVGGCGRCDCSVGVSMSAHDLSDELLMLDVARGQREQLEILLRRYATPMMTFMRRMVFDPHRSEELFQEVFFAVWKHRSRYEFPRSFRPWLYHIALNKCREEVRWRMRHPVVALDHLLEEPIAVGQPRPAEAAVAAEMATLVTSAVNQLPAQQCAVLVMRVWNELPFEEIGAALECTASTAHSHMHHALTILRKHLEPRMR